MVRLSDVIGNKGKPKDAPGLASPTPASTPPTAPLPPAGSIPAAPLAQPPPGSMPSAPGSGLTAWYAKLLGCMTVLLQQARSGAPLQLGPAVELIRQAPQIPSGQYDAVLQLGEHAGVQDYLTTHCVNVSLLASHLGRCLGYGSEEAQQLALAGLLIDIGMAGRLEALAQQPRPLTKEERQAIQTHPSQAIALLTESRELSRHALQAIADHHLHPDGGGYPQEHHAARLNEYAKILAVADAYDALTHARSHRRALSPAHAVKILIDGAEEQFDRRVVKVLVDELSLYPRGSVVRLSTNEVGTVERINPGAPLRPVVSIYRAADATPVIPPKSMNLIDHPLVYVKDVVVEEA